MEISRDALVTRINRKLLPNDEELKKARGHSTVGQVGRYYVRTFNRGFITEKHVDIEELGRRLEVLYPGETVEAES
jgi:hypothetical protein